MAERHEIQFIIDNDGNVQIVVNSREGKDCVALTKEFEEALGVVSNRSYTSEYYKQEISDEEKVSVKEEK